MGDEIVVAKESFSTEINGTPRVVTKGETFREGHPVIEGREEMFEPFEVDNELETATAHPDKRRTGGSKGAKQASVGIEQSSELGDQAETEKKASTEKKADTEPEK